jgi:plasmid stability protein
MKTLELPDAVMTELQNRAAREGRAVQDIVAALLAAGPARAEPTGSNGGQPVAKTLPQIKARPAQPTDVRKLSTQEWCDWIKEVDLQLEVERYEKALGHQYVDRTGD